MDYHASRSSADSDLFFHLLELDLRVHLVRRYDDHCVWANNAVGAGNHRLFLGFLAASLLNNVVMFALAAWLAVSGRAFGHGQAPVLGLLGVLCVSCFVLMVQGRQAKLQWTMIGRNITQTEEGKKRRLMYFKASRSVFRNPFDRGSKLRNWKEFLLANGPLAAHGCGGEGAAAMLLCPPFDHMVVLLWVTAIAATPQGLTINAPEETQPRTPASVISVTRRPRRTPSNSRRGPGPPHRRLKLTRMCMTKPPFWVCALALLGRYFSLAGAAPLTNTTFKQASWGTFI